MKHGEKRELADFTTSRATAIRGRKSSTAVGRPLRPKTPLKDLHWQSYNHKLKRSGITNKMRVFLAIAKSKKWVKATRNFWGVL